jgi:hypothetical protein
MDNIVIYGGSVLPKIVLYIKKNQRHGLQTGKWYGGKRNKSFSKKEHKIFKFRAVKQALHPVHPVHFLQCTFTLKAPNWYWK